MNQLFCDIDYKRPISGKNDFRTSTYRAHRYIDGTMLDTKINVIGPQTNFYVENANLERTRISDYQDNFSWKYTDPNALRNPALDKSLQFVKPYSEKLNFFMERNMRPAESTSRRDFTFKTPAPEPDPNPIFMPHSIAVNPVAMERMEHGFTKYLDPSATTQRLDYCQRSPQQIMKSIAAHDNITFWNWKQHSTPAMRVSRSKDEQLCDYAASKDCIKRINEFPSTVKRVPNSGMTTETRQNYKKPILKEIEFDTSEIRNDYIHLPELPFPKKTEQRIIGSGERVQKYVG